MNQNLIKELLIEYTYNQQALSGKLINCTIGVAKTPVRVVNDQRTFQNQLKQKELHFTVKLFC